MYYNVATGIKQNRGLFSTTAILVLVGLFVLISAYTAINYIAPAFAKNASQKSAVDTIVKSETPDKNNDRLYIPSAVIHAPVREKLANSIILHRGNTFMAPRLNVGLTPMETIKLSPLYHLGDVKTGDQIYVDQTGERLVYEATKVQADADTTGLSVAGDGNIIIYNYDSDRPDIAVTAVFAQRVGTVTWADGMAKIERE